MADTGNKPRYAAGPTILGLVGIIAVVVVLVKAMIIGYYDSDLPWMGIVGLGGAACIWISTKWAERS